MKSIAGSVLVLLCAAAFTRAQDPPTPPTDTPPETPAATPAVPVRGALPSQEPQPYEKVITKDAKSTNGIFTVHVIKDKHYYEIPKSELDKQFLWNT